MSRGFSRALLLLPLALLAAGCGTSGEESNVTSLPDDATVTYAFHDASVPPQYHRSVTLTVNRTESRIVVDSYGDVLADERQPTPAEVWSTLGRTLDDLAEVTVAGPEEGCVGGTGIDLIVATADASIIDLDPQFCGGANEGLDERITAWIAPARELFADTDVLAPEGE